MPIQRIGSGLSRSVSPYLRAKRGSRAYRPGPREKYETASAPLEGQFRDSGCCGAKTGTRSDGGAFPGRPLALPTTATVCGARSPTGPALAPREPYAFRSRRSPRGLLTLSARDLAPYAGLVKTRSRLSTRWSAGRLSVVMVASLAVVASACTNNNPKAQSSSTTTTTTVATGQNITADKALAQQASLKLADFPAGWTSQPPSSTNADQTLTNQLASCLGTSASQLSSSPAEYESPTYSDSSNNTAANRVVYRATAAEVKSAFDVISGPKAPACYSKAVQAVINDAIQHPSNPQDTLPAGASVGQTTFSPMSFPTYGDATVAYRVKVPVSYSGLSIDAYIDVVASIKGRSAVTMLFEGVTQPFPTDQEQHYTDVVVGRLTNT